MATTKTMPPPSEEFEYEDNNSEFEYDPPAASTPSPKVKETGQILPEDTLFPGANKWFKENHPKIYAAMENLMTIPDRGSEQASRAIAPGRSKAQRTSDLIEGVGTLASPLALAAGPGNVVPIIKGVAKGAIAGTIAEKGSEALGNDPDTARAVRDVAGVVGAGLPGRRTARTVVGATKGAFNELGNKSVGGAALGYAFGGPKGAAIGGTLPLVKGAVEGAVEGWKQGPKSTPVKAPEPFSPGKSTQRNMPKFTPGDTGGGEPGRIIPRGKFMPPPESSPEPFKPGDVTRRNMPGFTPGDSPSGAPGKNIPRGKFMPPPEEAIEPKAPEPFRPNPNIQKRLRYTPDSARSATAGKPVRRVINREPVIPLDGEAATNPSPKSLEGGKKTPSMTISEDKVRQHAASTGISEEEAGKQLVSEGYNIMKRGEINRAVHAAGRDVGLDHSALDDVANQTFKKGLKDLSADEMLKMHDALLDKPAKGARPPNKGGVPKKSAKAFPLDELDSFAARNKVSTEEAKARLEEEGWEIA